MCLLGVCGCVCDVCAECGECLCSWCVCMWLCVLGRLGALGVSSSDRRRRDRR